MKKKKNYSERRKNVRLKSEDDAIPLHEKSYQLIDIGLGGLAFHYFENEERPDESFKLGLLFDNDGQWLNDISYKIISDFSIDSPLTSSSGKIRRCGIQFNEFTPDQRHQLEYFIWSHSKEEA